MNIFPDSNIDFKYILDSIGADITINGIPTRAIIKDSKVNLDFDDKTITTKEEIKRGDVISIDDDTYLVLSEVNSTRSKIERFKAIIRNTNYSIKFNFGGFIKLFPTILTNQALGLETNKYSIILASGQILVYLQENPDTLGISIGQRFIKIGNAYKISGINRSMKGLILLTCDVDTFGANDNREKEIADDIHTFSIEITNGATATVTEEDTLQLTTEFKRNGVAVDNPGFTYSYISSNTDVATVDSDGLITALKEGSATITLTLTAENNDTISNSIDITVESGALPDNFTVDISGDAEIPSGESRVYTAIVKNNNIVVSEPVTWSITNNGCGKIKSQTGTSCTVQHQDSGTETLTATLNKDSSVFKTKVLTFKGLW